MKYLKSHFAFLPCLVLLPVFMLVTCRPGLAAESDPPIVECFTQAAQRHNIPAELLVAVAEVESGLSATAINLAGASHLPASNAAAAVLLGKLAGQRATFDVGIMQVNRWWFDKYNEPYGKGLDVCFNIDFGARILAMAIKDSGFTWEAVGRYHSPTSWRKEIYARKIFNRLTRIMAKRQELPLEKYLHQRLGDGERVAVAERGEKSFQ